MAAAPPAGGGGDLPLPVPAPLSAKLATLFGDSSKDPTRGNVGSLMSPFLHDLNNAARNTDTPDIKNKIAQSGAQRRFIAATITSNGYSRMYTGISRWDDDLVSSHPELEGKFFAFEGELIHNQGHTVEINDVVFHLPTTSVTVPTITAIVDALGTDETLTLMGPYTAGDGNTTVVKTRKIVPIPHFLGGLWTAKADGMTARDFWLEAYPLIQSEGKEEDCKALLQYFQAAITRTGANAAVSTIDTPRPIPPARNVALIHDRQSRLEVFFPQLRTDAPQHQSNLIAQGLGVIAQQQHEQYQETKRDREEAKSKTITKWLGSTKVKKLLRLTGMPNEAALVEACPVYGELASAPKGERLSVLNDACVERALARKEQYLSIVLSPGILALFTSLSWHRENPDSLVTGFLGNLFLFGPTDAEHQAAFNTQASLALGGHAAASTQDAKEILKVEVNLPMENKSLDNVKRLNIVCEVLLPDEHPFRVFVHQHLERMVAFQSVWEKTETTNPTNRGAKGVFHCQWFSLRASQYWKEQAMSASLLSLPSPVELFDDIELDKHWEPNLSTSLRQAVRWDALCRFSGGGGSGGGVPSDATARTADSSLSGLTDASAPALAAFLQQLRAAGLPPPRGGPPAAGGSQTATSNPDFNEVLFGDVKTRKVDGKVVKSRDIRQKISRNELPQLPTSRVDGSTHMCLAWHTKGMCNPECPFAVDHVKYDTVQYKPLKSWCDANYPKSS